MDKKIIKWMKWVDPMNRAEDEEENEFVEENIYEQETEYDKAQEIKFSKQIVLTTIFGAVPLHSNNKIEKFFNFYVGHTNFKITQQIKTVIDDWDGIETLDIFSPYRFRVSIGLAFDTKEVLKGLTEALTLPPKIIPIS